MGLRNDVRKEVKECLKRSVGEVSFGRKKMKFTRLCFARKSIFRSKSCGKVLKYGL